MPHVFRVRVHQRFSLENAVDVAGLRGHNGRNLRIRGPFRANQKISDNGIFRKHGIHQFKTAVFLRVHVETADNLLFCHLRRVHAVKGNGQFPQILRDCGTLHDLQNQAFAIIEKFVVRPFREGRCVRAALHFHRFFHGFQRQINLPVLHRVTLFRRLLPVLFRVKHIHEYDGRALIQPVMAVKHFAKGVILPVVAEPQRRYRLFIGVCQNRRVHLSAYGMYGGRPHHKRNPGISFNRRGNGSFHLPRAYTVIKVRHSLIPPSSARLSGKQGPYNICG